MTWNKFDLDELRRMWAAGLSTPAIARAMGRSKNSVVGAAHRAGLPGRPSSIVRGEARRAAPPPARAGKITLPVEAPVAVPALAGAPVAVPPVTALAATRIIPCQWPTEGRAESGRRCWTFCHADSLPGRSYCADHARIAFVRVRAAESEPRPETLLAAPVSGVGREWSW